jgi:nickel/cobalt transporter (NicO) family protein
MQTLLIGTALMSIFHALIPSHWLPVVAIGREAKWSSGKVLRVTLLLGLAHVLGTVLLGLVLAGAGQAAASAVTAFTEWVAPSLLVLMGIFYIYRHYYHHHFHLHRQDARWGVVASLMLAMFLSPCLEIEANFFAAGQFGWPFVGLLALVYSGVTLLGMLVWVRLVLGGLERINWHAWEHFAGLISGVVLIVSGVILFFSE